MRKRLILATVAVAVIAFVILSTLAMLPPRPGVTKANFDRIEKGMTWGKVEEIFGEKGRRWHYVAPEKTSGFWTARDESIVTVEFVDECVIEKIWPGSNEPFPNKIRRWLHLP